MSVKKTDNFGLTVTDVNSTAGELAKAVGDNAQIVDGLAIPTAHYAEFNHGYIDWTVCANGTCEVWGTLTYGANETPYICTNQWGEDGYASSTFSIMLPVTMVGSYSFVSNVTNTQFPDTWFLTVKLESDHVEGVFYCKANESGRAEAKTLHFQIKGRHQARPADQKSEG